MKIRHLVLIVVIIFLFDLAYFYPKLTSYIAYEKYEPEAVNITRVLDGDTFEADDENGKVRLLCINTPEKSRPYYEEAKLFLQELENREAEILRDKTNKDRYERKLRYLFYQDRFINYEILERGLAHLYLCENLRYEKELRGAEEKARKQEKGIWKKSTSKCASCFLLKELNAEEEFFTLKNSCGFDCENLEIKDEANHFFKIDEIRAGEERTFYSKSHVWNDAGDSLFLRDESGLVLYYSY